ncbi:MAG: hypothetical protein L0Z73_15995 [Gammaproteobacteria bacterium]|nr:hypothetical protein [Gammaproteobacteria bacterium]
MKHFIILLGGPGQFQGCDKAHDQTWTNYIVPLQMAAQKDLYTKEADENVHWVVYEPPYRNRWLDDSVITKAEAKQSDGYWLHSIRKKAADKVINSGASNYLHRIKTIAKSLGITYCGVSTPQEFWDYLETFPKNSISRVYYSGHASPKALLLSLIHNSACEAGAENKDVIKVDDISKNSKLADRFVTGATRASKFYGCYTSDFANEWHNVFSVPAEGALHKIDFGSIDRPSSFNNVLERLQQTGKPEWKAYR